MISSMTAFSRHRAAGVALGVAACVGGGCAVERATAVELVDVTGDAGATAGEASIDAAADAPGDAIEGMDGVDGTSSAEEGPDDSGDSSSCANPVFVTAIPLGIRADGNYFVFNNVWDTPANPGPQTLYVCSYHSWYVVSDQVAGDAGLVKSYPNVQMNFGNTTNMPMISSFHTITSTFAETSPHVGIYEDSYDIWLNGVDTAGSDQVTIWLDNYNRVPDGSQVQTMTLGGRTYDVWRTSDGTQTVLVSPVTYTNGNVDLLEILNWVIAQGWLAADSTLGQIDFGVEIVSTDGANATFQFDDFSITTD
jgi:hypothetical protein